MKLLIALICAAALQATSFTVNQTPAFWHTTTDFTPNGTPGFGDSIINAQYSLACEVGQTCDLGTVNSTSMTLGDGTHAASFTNNGTFVLRGQGLLQGSPYDCSHGPGIALATGSLTEMDQNGGAAASGFITASGNGPCVPFTIGTSGDQCTWNVASSTSNAVGSGSLTFTVQAGLSISVGNFVVAYKSTDGTVYVSGPVTAYSGTSLTMTVLNYSGSGTLTAWTMVACPTGVTSINSGSANGVLLTEGATGNGSTAMNWNGFAITGCGSTSTTVGCLNGEFNNTFGGAEWLWTQGYIGGSGYFSTNPAYGMATTVPVNINGVVSQGRLGNADIFLGTSCSSGVYTAFVVTTPACSVTRSITNSLLSWMSPTFGADISPMGFTVDNNFFDGFASSDLSLTAANIAGGSWAYNVVGNTSCSSGTVPYPAILAPLADHTYSICSGTANTEDILLTLPSNNTWHANVSVTNLILDDESPGSATSHSHCFLIGQDGAADAGYNFTINRAIVITDQTTGWASCQFAGWSGACQAAPYISVKHVYTASGNIPWYFCDGSAIATTAPETNIWQGNIFNATTSNDLNAIGLPNSQPAQIANLLDPAGTDYNVNFNYTPFVSTSYSACSSGCTSTGTPYAIPMTGTVPGPHDMNVNPGVAANHSAATWAATLGQAASYQGFRQVFANGGPAMIQSNVQAVFNYDCVAYTPTYAPIFHTLPDGSTPGPCEPSFPASSLGGPVRFYGVQIH